MARDILVVEDDPMVGQLFERILVENGYSVSLAVDGDSALRQLEQLTPAAILLGLRLPTIDGLEFLRRVRARPALASIPVAVVTGDYFVDAEVSRQIEALGARIHFKPIWEHDLIRLVGDLTAPR